MSAESSVPVPLIVGIIVVIVVVIVVFIIVIAAVFCPYRHKRQNRNPREYIIFLYYYLKAIHHDS